MDYERNTTNEHGHGLAINHNHNHGHGLAMNERTANLIHKQ